MTLTSPAGSHTVEVSGPYTLEGFGYRSLSVLATRGKRSGCSIDSTARSTSRSGQYRRWALRSFDVENRLNRGSLEPWELLERQKQSPIVQKDPKTVAVPGIPDLLAVFDNECFDSPKSRVATAIVLGEFDRRLDPVFGLAVSGSHKQRAFPAPRERTRRIETGRSERLSGSRVPIL